MKQVSIVALVLLAAMLSCIAQTKTNRSDANLSDEQQIINLEQKWAEALVAEDVDALRSILSDDFAISGANYNKESYLALIQSPDFKYTSAKKSDLKVRLYGDTAIVFGRQSGGSQYRGGVDFATFSFMNVWVKQKGQWRCVATSADSLNAKKG
jgi:ketosteroid isomerase-like protein